MHDFGQGDVGKALNHLRFDEVKGLFVAVGIPPSESEASCASWAFNIACTPIIEFMRDGSSDLDPVIASHLDTLLIMQSEVAQVCAECSPMAQLVSFLGALVVIVQTALSDGRASRLPRPPSQVRASLRLVESLPAGLVPLAFQHGACARLLRARCEDHVKKNAMDTVGTSKFQKALSHLKAQECLVSGADGPYVGHDRLMGMFHDARAAVDMWSLPVREGMHSQVIEFATAAKKFITTWAMKIMQCVNAEAPTVKLLLQSARGEATLDDVDVSHGMGAGIVDGNASQALPVLGVGSPQHAENTMKLTVLLDTWEGKLQCDWSKLMSVASVMAAVVNHMKASQGQASIDEGEGALDSSDWEPMSVANDFVADCLQHLRSLLKSLRCLITRDATASYDNLMAAWVRWMSLAEDAKNATDPPALHLILEGVGAVQALRECSGRRLEGTLISMGAVSGIVDIVLNDSVAERFGSLVKGMVTDCLRLAHATSSSARMALQGADTLERCAAEGRLGASSGNMVAFQATVRNALNPVSWTVPDAWPSLAPLDIALQCFESLQAYDPELALIGSVTTGLP